MLTVACCDCCFNPMANSNSIALPAKLCLDKSCANICHDCIQQYFDFQLENSYAICKPIRCPGSCNQIIPMQTWKKYTKPASSQKYKEMMLARLSIRCPSCHSTKQFAGHAKVNAGNVVLEGKSKAFNRPPRPTTPGNERYQQRLKALGVTSAPTTPYYTPTLQQRMVEQHDLSVATQVVQNYMAFCGETKETLGTEPLIQFVNHCADMFGENNLEKFSSHFLAFVQQHPHIKTGCCSAKVCFKCHTKGWHESTQGSCSLFLEGSKSKIKNIHPCPKCKVRLVKSEGCDSVTCPMCSHSFTWKKRMGSSEIALARFRGNGSTVAAVGTIRGNYVRTATGWAVRTREE